MSGEENTRRRMPGPGQSKPGTGSAQPGKLPDASAPENKRIDKSKASKSKAERQARTTGGQQGGRPQAETNPDAYRGYKGR